MDARDISDFFDTQHANCRGENIELFYPVLAHRQRTTREHTKTAKEICDGCSVTDKCLEYSLYFEPLGFWGGRTEIEREVLRRKRSIFLPIERKPSDNVRRMVRTGRIRRTEHRLDSESE